MASHKLQLTYDDATGDLTVTHRCIVAVGGHDVSHAEPVTLDASAAAAFKAILDANREEMERRTTTLAVQHAAAIAGRLPPNTKSLAVGGNLGAIGATQVKP